jgi:hypothetical protein
MTNKKQEHGQRLTLDNLATSIPERINAAMERMKSDSVVKKTASQMWAKRGENYDAFSFELGNKVADFLKNYVAKVWPTIKEYLERSGEGVFEVDALTRKFMREQPYLSFCPSGDSPIIRYYSGFRSGASNYDPTNISGILEKEPNKVQDLGRTLFSEKSFYGNECYSKWDKTVQNVPELPSEHLVQELYDEFTNCVLLSTAKALETLLVESLNE